MPAWLQVVGAIASAILSYYTSYDDTKVRDMLRDIAYNQNLALQKLDQVAFQIDKLGVAIDALPPEIQQIVHSQALITLNTTINGALIRYKNLLAEHHGPDNDFFKNQVVTLYNDVSKARAELEAISRTDNVEYAPLAAAVSPFAMLLELSLLYRVGKQGNNLRAATTKDFQAWFARILDPNVQNSLATYLSIKTTALTQSDKNLASGLLQLPVANPGTRQAFYCLENEIGGTSKVSPLMGGRPGETWAELLGLTWIRFCGVTTLNQTHDQGVVVWSVGPDDPKLDLEQYARKGPSDVWYGQKPSYAIAVDSYDSEDIQRFQGQDHPSRVRDILNSPKWHDFVANRFPTGKQQLAENNQFRIDVKLANDITIAVKAAQNIVHATLAGQITSIAE